MGLILCALRYAPEVNMRWRLMCVFKIETIIHRSNFEDSQFQVWALIFECHIVLNDWSGLLLQHFVINIERLLRTKAGSKFLRIRLHNFVWNIFWLQRMFAKLRCVCQLYSYHVKVERQHMFKHTGTMLT